MVNILSSWLMSVYYSYTDTQALKDVNCHIFIGFLGFLSGIKKPTKVGSTKLIRLGALRGSKANDCNLPDLFSAG
jgi:hypothetical protein